MKKSYLLCAAALCVAACQKPQGEAPLAPDVELKSLEATANTFSFTIAASSADKAAYVCLEADAVAPSVDDILSDGTSVDVSGEPVTVELEGLAAETSYVVYAAASNAESVMQQPKTLAFSTTVDWYADVTSTSTLAWYFGYDEAAGGDYSGTYTPNHDWENGYANYTYLPGFVMDYYGMKMPVGTYLSEYDESGSMVRIGMVVDGDMDVSIKDGVLKMSGVFTTDKGHEITVSYEGPENLTDMTGGMSTSSMTVKPAQKPAGKAAVSGWRAL